MNSVNNRPQIREKFDIKLRHALIILQQIACLDGFGHLVCVYTCLTCKRWVVGRMAILGSWTWIFNPQQLCSELARYEPPIHHG